MNTRSAICLLESRSMIKVIDQFDGLSRWEKRFMRRIKRDINEGLGLSTWEGKTLHEIYRKSLEGNCPTYYFPEMPKVSSGGVCLI